MVDMGTVAFFWAAITLIIPEIYLASKVVNGIGCERVECPSSAAQCPPWHYCDMNRRICEPCTQCTDGSDVDHPRGNCRDPVSCIETLYARQDHACCKLRIADGYNCSGECIPCGGSIGSSLGTTCKANCTDGAWEVFSCIFMNNQAQWNVSRMPHWIVCDPPESPLLPQPPRPIPPTTSPATTSTSPISPPTASFTVYHLEVPAGIVAGTVLGVATIVFFAIALVVCVRRKKIQKKSSESKEPMFSLAEKLVEERPLTSYIPPTPRLNKPGREPVENVDPEFLVDSCDRVPVENGTSVRWENHPTENSVCDSSSWNSRFETPLKNYGQLLPGQSIISLVSERSDSSPSNGHPQEHSPAPVYTRRPAGSSDSGHPPCRDSSSNSLHLHETMRKSVMDLSGRDFRGGPVEISQETSSGFPPRYSLQDLLGRDLHREPVELSGRTSSGFPPRDSLQDLLGRDLHREPVELSGGTSSSFPPRDSLQDIYRFSDMTDGWSPCWPVNIGSPVEIHDTSE